MGKSLRLLLGSLLATALVGASAGSGSYTAHAQRLRRQLFKKDTYDPMVVPNSSRSDGNGTDVFVNLRVFKVESVDIATSHLRLSVWFRTSWVDEREIAG